LLIWGNFGTELACADGGLFGNNLPLPALNPAGVMLDSGLWVAQYILILS